MNRRNHHTQKPRLSASHCANHLSEVIRSLLERSSSRYSKFARSEFSHSELGYSALTVLVLVAAAAVATAASLKHSQTTLRSLHSANVRVDRYYETEEALGTAVSWLRENSSSLALPFSRSMFYTLFDRTAPTEGENENTADGVATKIKMRGTNSSVILASNTTLASSAFPDSTDAITGSSFNAKSSFASSSVSEKLLRITLIDAVPADESKDFGDPDLGNPEPQTDFAPVYRIDAMESALSGAYLVGYVVGALSYDYGTGFLGRDFIDLRQSCDSYLSNTGNYSSTTRRANCPVASQGTVSIHSSETVYGTGRANGGINNSSPYGGKVCADFASGCANPGQICSGATCKVPALPSYSPWSTYCPTNQGNLQISNNTTLLVSSNAPQSRCWNQITVNNNRVLTLRSTSYAYFIDTFSVANNGRINFSPNPATGTVNLYVRKFSGDSFNGNQVYNINNKPYQLRIHYLGTDNLTLNGNVAMNAFITAPYAQITIQGNFDYKGGIKATGLTLTGSGDLHYDESGDITTIADTTYRVRSVSQKYHY